MTPGLFAPRARRELLKAAADIAEHNPDAADHLLTTAIAAARRVTEKPMLARTELKLAPARYRFWSLRGFPYLLVIDTESEPPVVARFVHEARDLWVVLDDL